MSITPAQQTETLFTMRQDGDAAVLRVAADLVQPASGEVRRALVHLLENRPGRLRVDLGRAGSIDEAGLGALLVAALWARKFGVEFAVIPSPSARSRLTTARLDGYLTLVEPG